MLIALTDIIILYEKMIQDLNVDYLSVIVFTGIDIDSLCTLKMLSKFFKGESIQFKVYPVITSTQLQEKIEEVKIQDTVKIYMFINCGGNVDLSAKWLTEVDGGKIFLFDINKPILCENIESPKVLIVDDDNSEFEKRITIQQINKFQQLQEFDLDVQQGDDQSDNQDNQSQQSGVQSPKRSNNNRRQIAQKLKKHRDLLQNKITNYLSNTFFSLPSSYCMYRLIRQTNKANNYFLWYAIVAMTSMFLQNVISSDNLKLLTTFYRTDMIKFNPQSSEKHEKGEIYTKKGYQFTLLNHWTLYDSMINSPYLMVKLGLWNDKGLMKLQEILTKIGISLAQSKQLYKYMHKDSKKLLQDKIYIIAQHQNLIEITYESFMYQGDISNGYMASDYYYMLTGLLQKSTYNNKSTPEQVHNHRIECFWNAYSILDDSSQQMIKESIESYKDIVKFLMLEAKNIIERDNIIQMNSINFANIRCDTKEKRIFEHPNVLMKFGTMLMGIQKQRFEAMPKEQQMKSKLKPFVLSLFDIEKGLCTIVGVSNRVKNNFGDSFGRAAQKLNIKVQHDRFMTNIIIIAKQNLHEFIKELGTNPLE